MDVITTCRLVYVSLCVSPFFYQSARRLNCFNDQLVYTFYFGSFSRQLVCLSCKEVVRKPQTRMKLVVFLSGTSKCDSTPVGHVSQPLPPESKVSVELLQCSIEELLPDASQTQEGYDMACVLGQKMGPLTCVVLKCKPSEVVLKEVSVDPQK